MGTGPIGAFIIMNMPSESVPNKNEIFPNQATTSHGTTPASPQETVAPASSHKQLRGSSKTRWRFAIENP